MKHNEIATQLAADAARNPNILGFLLFGSVAAGAQREDSDIDVASVLHRSKPSSGINRSQVDGIQVGDIFMSYDVFSRGVESVPYLLHPLASAKVLYDRDGTVGPLIERLQAYFSEHPQIISDWDGYYRQLRQEKVQFGCEKTTIIEVWNELERRYSGGKIRRPFFCAYYMTNPRIFAFLKRFL